MSTITISGVKKIKSPTKNSPKDRKYLEYLNNSSKDNKQIQVKSKSRSRSRSNKKKKVIIKDINDIEKRMKILMNNERSNKNVNTSSDNKANKSKNSKTNNSSDPKSEKSNPTTKSTKLSHTSNNISHKNHNNKSNDKTSSKNNLKEDKKRSTKRRNSRNNKRNRSIIVKSKQITDKDISTIHKKINQIRGKKPDEIREILKKKGIKVTGKSNRLLKDIYLYSSVCNINITHE